MCNRLTTHIPGHCPPTRLVLFDLATFDRDNDPRALLLLDRLTRLTNLQYVPDDWMAL